VPAAGVEKSAAELAALIGPNRASQNLNRVRPLTLEMIRTISREWNILIGALAANTSATLHLEILARTLSISRATIAADRSSM
jgi:hypothetical protein